MTSPTMMQDSPHSGPHRLLVRLGDVEVFGALLLSAFVFLVAIGIGGGIMLSMEWGHLSTMVKVVGACGYSVVMICEVRSLGWITQGLQIRRSPRAVWLAMSLPHRGFLLNSVLAAWWIIHLGTILTAGIMLDMAVSSADSARAHSDGSAHWVAQIAGVLVLFLATYMSSSFLVLAVGSLWRRETLLRKLWRTRALIDAVVVMGVVLVQRWI